MALFTLSLHRWPAVAPAAVLMAVSVAWELPHPPPMFNAAGVSLYFIDVVCTAMLIVAMSGGRVFFSTVGRVAWAWLGLGVVLLISLLIGLLHQQTGAAFNEFRTFFYPYAAISWAIVQSRSHWFSGGTVPTFSMLLGWSLVLVATYHFSQHGLGDTSEFVEAATGVEQTTRPLISGQAFMLLLAAIVTARNAYENRKKIGLVSAVCFLFVALISQQRTVWAVGFICLAAVMVIGRPRLRMSLILKVTAAAWLAAIAVIIGMLSGSIADLGRNAINSGTYDARVRSWIALIEDSSQSGVLTVLFGSPMGSGFGRYEGPGRWVEFAPHNWYVTIYLRAGIVGLVCLGIFFAVILARLSRLRDNPARFAVILAVLIYGWSYSWLWYFCIFIGWAVAHRGDLASRSTPSLVSVGMSRGYSDAIFPTARGNRKEQT